jgi:predicted RecB family nuclease
LIDDSPLLKLQQLGRNRLQQFHAAGITGFDQINEQNRALLKTLPGVGDYHVDLWIRQIAAIRAKVPIREKEKALDLIGKDYILYDIETDLENKNVFMIGCYVSSTREFKQFFEKKSQKKLLKEFIKYVDGFPNHSLVSFSNCYFERRVLTGVCERESIRTTRFTSEIDLGIPISSLLIGDYRGYSVKTLGEDLGFSRQSTLDGLQVGQQYTEYLLSGQEPDWNAIAAYNKEDVLQLKHIVDFLLQ